MSAFSLLYRAASNRKKRPLRRGNSLSRSLTARVRLSVECLEDRTLLSNGQWLVHITGLPGDTTQEQIAATQALLHNAGLDGPSPVASRSSVQVLDHMGADGILLIKTETTDYGKSFIDQAGLTSELQVIPGFDYVEAYDPDDDPDSRRSWFPTGPNQEHEGGDLVPRFTPPPRRRSRIRDRLVPLSLTRSTGSKALMASRAAKAGLPTAWEPSGHRHSSRR